MKLTFIRHSITNVDPNVSPLLWGLTDEGVSLSKKLAQSKYVKDVEVLYSSLQLKSLETAILIAKELKIPIRTNDNLTEVTSFTRGFIENYEDSSKLFHLDKITRINEGESKVEAVDRFSRAIERIVNREINRTNIGIDSHCNIMSLFAEQFSEKNSYKIHNQMKTPDFAVLDLDEKEFDVMFGSWWE